MSLSDITIEPLGHRDEEWTLLKKAGYALGIAELASAWVKEGDIAFGDKARADKLEKDLVSAVKVYIGYFL